MDALADAFRTDVLPVLWSLLIAAAIALTTVAAQAVRLLQARGIAWLEERARNDAHRSAIAKLDEAARSAVSAVEQTIAKDLRELEPNVGHLSSEQAQRTLEAAMEAARGHLGMPLWRELAETLELGPAGLEALLRTRIEAAVFELRQGIRSLNVTA